MGNGKFQPAVYSKISERISITLSIYNYILGATAHANPCCTVTMWVVSTNFYDDITVIIDSSDII